MKLPKSILLTAFAWLVLSSTPAQASYFECPVGEVCSYAASPVTSAQVTALLTDGDITGGPADFDHDSGLALAAPASSLDSVGIITTTLSTPIYQSLFIVTNEMATPTILDERMEVLVSTNGVDFNSLGVKYNYNANDPLALIDLTGFASLSNPVTHIQIKGIHSEYADSPDCDPENRKYDCTPIWINETEVLGIAGISASTVPVPAAVWLFGSGLIGLVGIARRRRK
jgi:hypothetical protein